MPLRQAQTTFQCGPNHVHPQPVLDVSGWLHSVHRLQVVPMGCPLQGSRQIDSHVLVGIDFALQCVPCPRGLFIIFFIFDLSGDQTRGPRLSKQRHRSHRS